MYYIVIILMRAVIFMRTLSFRQNMAKQNMAKQNAAPALLAQHPYLCLISLFWAILGIAAGISIAASGVPGMEAHIGRALGALQADQPYRLFPAILHAAAWNLCLLCIAGLSRLFAPLAPLCGLPIALKGFFMGLSAAQLYAVLGGVGLVMSLPLVTLPAMCAMAAFGLRLIGGYCLRKGEPADSLQVHALSLLAVGIALEGAGAGLARWILPG
jgi:hypothetical protein